jgi:hypothetical protein
LLTGGVHKISYVDSVSQIVGSFAQAEKQDSFNIKMTGTVFFVKQLLVGIE